MEDNKLIKYEKGQLAKVGNAIAVTNKILDLAKAEPLLIPYRKGDKWGFCREDKTIVIDCVYDEVSPFKKGLAPIKKNNKCGLINNRGHEVFDHKYDLIRYDPLGNEFWCTENWNKRGLIDNNGHEIIEPTFDNLYSISKELIQVFKADKVGLINNYGHLIVPCIYDNIIIEFSENLADVSINDKCGFIDEKGNQIIPLIYGSTSAFSEGKLNQYLSMAQCVLFFLYFLV